MKVIGYMKFRLIYGSSILKRIRTTKINIRDYIMLISENQV